MLLKYLEVGSGKMSGLNLHKLKGRRVTFEPFKERRFQAFKRDGELVYTNFGAMLSRVAIISRDYYVEEGFHYQSINYFGPDEIYHELGFKVGRFYHFFYLFKNKKEVLGFQRYNGRDYAFFVFDGEKFKILSSVFKGEEDIVKSYAEALRKFEKLTGLKIANPEFKYESTEVESIIKRLLTQKGFEDIVEFLKNIKKEVELNDV